VSIRSAIQLMVEALAAWGTFNVPTISSTTLARSESVPPRLKK
jgi:hypothetical protein